MIDIEIFNISGDKTGSVQVDPESLGTPISPSLLHRAVVSYEANLRQGSACTKTRGDKSGSGKKLWKQKGTGRARMGSIRSPLWRGGGVTFGPKPRDFRMKLSKKERQLALRGALQGKLSDQEVKVIDSLQLSECKTKLVASFLKKTGTDGRVLFISEKHDADWLRASGNIKGVSTHSVSSLNALEVLKNKTLIFEKTALEKIIKSAS